MIRETSIEAYRNLVEGGTLAKMNKLVYEYLYHAGPTSQKKTERKFNDRTYTLRPRFAQLEEMGLIKHCGHLVCEETGKKNMIWDVTDRIHPLPPKKRATRGDLLAEIETLKIRVYELEEKFKHKQGSLFG